MYPDAPEMLQKAVKIYVNALKMLQKTLKMQQNAWTVQQNALKNAAKNHENYISKFIKSAPKCIEIAPKAAKTHATHQNPPKSNEIPTSYIIFQNFDLHTTPCRSGGLTPPSPVGPADLHPPPV